MKYKEATKGLGMRKLFRQNNYKVYLVDEFRTSCMCSMCGNENGKCEKFMIKKNPKPYRSGNILCHGLLRCENCKSVWNRDVNSATNIYRISKNAISGIERPKYLCREKPKEYTKKKRNTSVKVVALTKS